MTLETLETDDNALVAALVRRAQAGDGDAFGALVERFERVVFAIALRRLRDYSEAEELTQDVLLQAFTKLDQLRDAACFGGWLRSITVRMAINRAIRRPNDVAVEPEVLAATVSDGREPVDRLLDRERQSEVRAGLARLRRMDRETLEAFYFGGQSLIEMADRFDAPVGTIKRRLHVARKRLAKHVADPVAL
ncbi:MAG: sigma-70 family RNA polymerase sigma factor [Planctomycetales bacterium]|nr:sigma-70 family RNA polymerase sigma factor [Planctomycetales bacterium]